MDRNSMRPPDCDAPVELGWKNRIKFDHDFVGHDALEAIADLVGSVDRLPQDLSGRTKKYLKSTGYGEKRPG